MHAFHSCNISGQLCSIGSVFPQHHILTTVQTCRYCMLQLQAMKGFCCHLVSMALVQCLLASLLFVGLPFGARHWPSQAGDHNRPSSSAIHEQLCGSYGARFLCSPWQIGTGQTRYQWKDFEEHLDKFQAALERSGGPFLMGPEVSLVWLF